MVFEKQKGDFMKDVVHVSKLSRELILYIHIIP